jgi:hypothetical protein
MFKSVRTDITSSVRWMWTIRFTYFDSKCMHLSKLLHNQWSTCIGTDVVTSVRTDVNETVYIYMVNLNTNYLENYHQSTTNEI